MTGEGLVQAGCNDWCGPGSHHAHPCGKAPVDLMAALKASLVAGRTPSSDREPPPDTSWVQMESITNGPGYGAIFAPLIFCVVLAVIVIVAVLS